MQFIDPNDLDDDPYVVSTGLVGTPIVSLELLPSIDEAAHTLDALEQHVGLMLNAVTLLEMTGSNSLIPIVAATGKGIPFLLMTMVVMVVMVVMV